MDSNDITKSETQRLLLMYEEQGIHMSNCEGWFTWETQARGEV